MIAFIVNMDNRNPIIPIASGPTTCTHRSPVLSECLQTHKVMTAAKTQGGAQSNKVVPGSKPMVEAIVGKYMKKDTDKTAKYDARAIPQTFQSDAAAMNPFHVVVEALSVARGLLPESASSTILRLASSCSSRVSQEINSASGKSGRTNKARIATSIVRIPSTKNSQRHAAYPRSPSIKPKMPEAMSAPKASPMNMPHMRNAVRCDISLRRYHFDIMKTAPG